MPKREAAHIAQFDAFEMGPEALAGIQLWGIGGEAFQMEPVRRAIRQERLDARLRWIGAPSQIITIWPGTSRSRCSRKATTSSESIARSWQGK